MFATYMTGSLLACLAAAAFTIFIIGTLVRSYLTIEMDYVSSLAPSTNQGNGGYSQATKDNKMHRFYVIKLSHQFLRNEVIQLCDIKKVKPVDIKNSDYTSYIFKACNEQRQKYADV